MKKILSIVLVAVIFVSVFSFSASAITEPVRPVGLSYPTLYASNNSSTNVRRELAKYVDLDDFKKVIFEAASQCLNRVDISQFNIPYSDKNRVFVEDYIWYSIPEAFNIEGLGVGNNGEKFTYVVFSFRTFADTKEEFSVCYEQMVAAADKLLLGIENNNALDDVQKALLLHDRLAAWNKYDYDRLAEYKQDSTKAQEIFTAYGALAQRGSVCQGYAMAYMYLLDRVDIESYYCSSRTINHGWNIVYVGGKSYHVDVTWDDWDLGRIIGHNNFLRSSNGIYSTGHEATDYDTTPTDTKYDEYFWQKYQAEFQLAGNDVYYVDGDNAVIRRYSDQESVCNVEAKWSAGGNSFWNGNFTNIASDGKSLFYSQPKAIYRFDLTTNKSEVIFTPDLEADESIFEFAYENETLICDIGDTPHEIQRQVTQKYTYNYDDVQVIYGDTNGDGKLNTRDYAVLMQYLNGWDVEIDENAADVNGDGKLNTRDYAVLMQYLNGWDVTLG